MGISVTQAAERFLNWYNLHQFETLLRRPEYVMKPETRQVSHVNTLLVTQAFAAGCSTAGSSVTLFNLFGTSFGSTI